MGQKEGPGFGSKICFMILAGVLAGLAFLYATIFVAGADLIGNLYVNVDSEVRGHQFTDMVLFIVLGLFGTLGACAENTIALVVAVFGYFVMFCLQSATLYYSFNPEELDNSQFFYRTNPCQDFAEVVDNEEDEDRLRNCRASLSLRFFALFLNIFIIPFTCFLAIKSK